MHSLAGGGTSGSAVFVFAAALVSSCRVLEVIVVCSCVKAATLRQNSKQQQAARHEHGACNDAVCTCFAGTKALPQCWPSKFDSAALLQCWPCEALCSAQLAIDG
jgi:hypothetical protein